MEDKDKTNPEETPETKKTPVQRLYDKIPLTYKQVDVIVKVLIGILALVLIVGFIQGNR